MRTQDWPLPHWRHRGWLHELAPPTPRTPLAVGCNRHREMVHDSSKPQFSKAVRTERSPYVSPSSSAWRSFISRFYFSFFFLYNFLLLIYRILYLYNFISWQITRIIDFRTPETPTPPRQIYFQTVPQLPRNLIYLYPRWKFDRADIFANYRNKRIRMEEIQKGKGPKIQFRNKWIRCFARIQRINVQIRGKISFQPNCTRFGRLPFFCFPRLIPADVEGSLAAGLHVWFCATSSFINKAQLKRSSQGDGVAWPGDPDFLWLASFTISPHQVLRQRHVSGIERERGWVRRGWDQIEWVSEWECISSTSEQPPISVTTFGLLSRTANIPACTAADRKTWSNSLIKHCEWVDRSRANKQCSSADLYRFKLKSILFQPGKHAISQLFLLRIMFRSSLFLYLFRRCSKALSFSSRERERWSTASSRYKTFPLKDWCRCTCAKISKAHGVLLPGNHLGSMEYAVHGRNWVNPRDVLGGVSLSSSSSVKRYSRYSTYPRSVTKLTIYFFV